MVATAARPAAPASASPGPPEGRSRVLTWAIGWTVAFGALFIRRSSTVVGGERTYTLFDDAMVSMRYAHNLARGDGLVWNIGQPGVEGYTNFLWTLWLTVLHWVGIPARELGLFVGLSGVALLVADLVVIAKLCRALAPHDRTVEWTALVLTATSYPLLFWTLRGMEVGLVALLLSVACLCAVHAARGNPRAVLGLTVASVAGVLTRTDVVVPLAVVLAYAVVFAPRRRLALMAPALTGAALVVHTLLRIRWYGEALPNTYALKLGGIPLSDRLERGVAVALLQLAVEVFVPFALAVVGLLAVRGRARRELALPATVVASCIAYAVYVGGDAWEWMRIADRYVAQSLPLLFVVSGAGLAHLARAVDTGRRRVLWWCVGALVAGAAVAHAAPFSRDLLQLDATSTDMFTTPLVAAALAVVVLIGALHLRDRVGPEQITDRVLVGVAALALVLASSGGAFGRWADTSGDHVSSDILMAHLSNAVNETAAPDATLAVAWAGSVPYFTDRPAIDLLGKSDPVIARSTPHDIPLYPGHMRWDYARSIGSQRPDLVVTMWIMTAGDVADLAAWGYVQPNQELPVWIRADTTKVDVPRLTTLLVAGVG